MKQMGNIDDTRIPGALSQLTFDTDNRDVFLDYMKHEYPSAASDLVWSMLGDKKFLMFYDVLEGATLRIPSRKQMAVLASEVSAYRYLNARGATEESYETCSKIFKIKTSRLHEIYKKIDDVMNGREEENSDSSEECEDGPDEVCGDE